MKSTPVASVSSEFLCQAGESVSCSACCGLYNVPDASFQALESKLAHRTRLYNQVPSDVDSIEAYKADIEAAESNIRPIEDFHHCPYIGLIGESQSRVGCLLHPMNPKNNGFDFRGLSYYGGMTCRVYFCPSTTKLPDTYAKVIKSIADNWHIYGLIITETRLLTAFFGEIERQAQTRIEASDILSSRQAKKTIQEFFNLKIKWPFRKKGHSYLGNYFFNDNLYQKPKIDYSSINHPVSRYNTILEELASGFHSKTTLHAAESKLDDIFDQIKKALYF